MTSEHAPSEGAAAEQRAGSAFQHILVTGAAGFIASQVCRLLLEQGCTVVGIDNLNDAYDTRMKTWRLEQLADKRGFTFRQADISDRAALTASLPAQPFDAVVNLAARAGVRQSVENPWVYIDTNVTGTLNPRPFSEDARTDGPLSPYAASKKAAEAFCYTYHYLYNIDVSVLRYFTVYGPAGRPDMSMFRFVQWISEGKPVKVFGDGRQERDFTYVEDIARGTIAALRPLGYEVINLGSDKPVALMDVIRLVEKLLDKEAQLVYQERHPADVFATWANIHKAERLLSWRPQTSLHEGTAQLVEWYRENEAWAREIHTG
jgi:nucleoside-diphosphate-sugar epimerase